MLPGAVVLALSLALIVPGGAETPVPWGAWSVEEAPDVLSIHSQQGLTVVVRVHGATRQDTGQRLGLTFSTAHPTRLTASVTGIGAAVVKAAFSATKVFPVSGFDVLAHGDSITAGVGAETPGGYPAILQGLLEARGLPLTVTNAGVGGESALEGAARLSVTLGGAAILPGTVLVLEGINGLDPDGSTVEAVLASLLDMVAGVRARGGLPILGTLTPVGPKDGRAAAVAALNARIRQLAAEQGIRLADHETAFRGNLGLLADQLHPNEAGYRRMAETWLAAILAAW